MASKKQFCEGFNNLSYNLGSRLRIDSRDRKTQFYQFTGSFSEGYEVVRPIGMDIAGKMLNNQPALEQYLETFNN